MKTTKTRSTTATTNPAAAADLVCRKAAEHFSQVLLNTRNAAAGGFDEISMLARLAFAVVEASPDHRNAEALMQALARISFVAMDSDRVVQGLARCAGAEA